ncbi:hypothetical protein [Sphingomonas sp. ABOLH]|uniref:hypothetical protein n=1 Tax=Sphingomonas sp. ABOLH TaxID=1985881 RepID=UPI000F7DB615|nr:hypothetical protein [Sphingomonas sp. ABOLH]RSV32164.1 hypothetical protein CA237_03605 [Sphingomonas sp. ABOLH]
MAIIGEVLFMRRDGGSVSDVVRHVEGQMQQQVDAYDERKFDAQSDAEVVDVLARDLSVEPLLVDFEKGEKNVEETTISVRDVFGDTGSVPGLILTKKFSFTGDADLWNFGTGQWGSMMPRGEIYGRTLTVGMEVRATDSDAAVQHITSTVEQIKHYLELQKAALDPFNASLPSQLLPLIEARRARRGSAQSLLDKF